MPRFGELIALRRAQLGLSQRDLVGKLAGDSPDPRYNQVAISRWERSEAYPDDEAVVLKLEGLLGLEAKELVTAWKEDKEPLPQRIGNTPVAYFIELRGELQYYEDDGRTCECWFVGPDVLPGLETDLPSIKWVENMKRGHNYHFLWILDYLTEGILEGMKILLKGMKDGGAHWTPNRDETKGPKMGSLTLYSLMFNPKNPYARKQREEFTKLFTRKSGIPWLKVCEKELENTLEIPVIAGLQEMAQKWATLISYYPTDHDFNRAPLASASTNCLRRSIADPVELNFFWFDTKRARRLRDTILPIEDLTKPD